MMLGENGGLKGRALRAGEPVSALDPAILTQRRVLMSFRAGCVRHTGRGRRGQGPQPAEAGARSAALDRSYHLQERAKRRGPWDFRKRRSELLACNQQKVLDRSRIGLIPVSHVCRIGAEPEFAAGLSAA